MAIEKSKKVHIIYLSFIKMIEEFSFELAKRNLLGLGFALEVLSFIGAGLSIATYNYLGFIAFLLNGGLWAYIVGRGIYYDTLINN